MASHNIAKDSGICLSAMKQKSKIPVRVSGSSSDSEQSCSEEPCRVKRNNSQRSSRIPVAVQSGRGYGSDSSEEYQNQTKQKDSGINLKQGQKKDVFVQSDAKKKTQASSPAKKDVSTKSNKKLTPRDTKASLLRKEAQLKKAPSSEKKKKTKQTPDAGEQCGTEDISSDQECSELESEADQVPSATLESNNTVNNSQELEAEAEYADDSFEESSSEEPERTPTFEFNMSPPSVGNSGCGDSLKDFQLKHREEKEHTASDVSDIEEQPADVLEEVSEQQSALNSPDDAVSSLAGQLILEEKELRHQGFLEMKQENNILDDDELNRMDEEIFGLLQSGEQSPRVNNQKRNAFYTKEQEEEAYPITGIGRRSGKKRVRFASEPEVFEVPFSSREFDEPFFDEMGDASQDKVQSDSRLKNLDPFSQEFADDLDSLLDDVEEDIEEDIQEEPEENTLDKEVVSFLETSPECKQEKEHRSGETCSAENNGLETEFHQGENKYTPVEAVSNKTEVKSQDKVQIDSRLKNINLDPYSQEFADDLDNLLDDIEEIEEDIPKEPEDNKLEKEIVLVFETSPDCKQEKEHCSGKTSSAENDGSETDLHLGENEKTPFEAVSENASDELNHQQEKDLVSCKILNHEDNCTGQPSVTSEESPPTTKQSEETVLSQNTEVLFEDAHSRRVKVQTGIADPCEKLDCNLSCKESKDNNVSQTCSGIKSEGSSPERDVTGVSFETSKEEIEGKNRDKDDHIVDNKASVEEVQSKVIASELEHLKNLHAKISELQEEVNGGKKPLLKRTTCQGRMSSLEEFRMIMLSVTEMSEDLTTALNQVLVESSHHNMSLERELAELKGDHLEALDKCKEEIKSLKEGNEELQLQLEEGDQQIRNIECIINSVNIENEKLLQQNDDLEDELNKALAEKNDILLKLEERNSVQEYKEKELSNLKDDMRWKNLNMQEIHATWNQMCTDKEQLEKDVGLLTVSLEQSEAAKLELEKKLKDMETGLEDIKLEQNATWNQMCTDKEKLEKDVGSLTISLEQSEAAKLKLEKQLKEMEIGLEDIKLEQNATWNQMCTDKEQLEKNVGALTVSFEQSEAAKLELEKKLKDMETGLEDIKLEQNATWNQMCIDKEKLQKDVNSLTISLEQSEAAKFELEKKLKDMETGLEDIKLEQNATWNQMCIDKEKLQKDVNSLTISLEQSEAAKLELEKKLKDMQTGLEDIKLEQNATWNQMCTDKQKLQKDVGLLTISLEQSEAAKLELEKKLKDMQTGLEDIKLEQNATWNQMCTDKEKLETNVGLLTVSLEQSEAAKLKLEKQLKDMETGLGDIKLEKQSKTDMVDYSYLREEVEHLKGLLVLSDVDNERLTMKIQSSVKPSAISGGAEEFAEQKKLFTSGIDIKLRELEKQNSVMLQELSQVLEVLKKREDDQSQTKVAPADESLHSVFVKFDKQLNGVQDELSQLRKESLSSQTQEKVKNKAQHKKMKERLACNEENIKWLAQSLQLEMKELNKDFEQDFKSHVLNDIREQFGIVFKHLTGSKENQQSQESQITEQKKQSSEKTTAEKENCKNCQELENRVQKLQDIKLHLETREEKLDERDHTGLNKEQQLMDKENAEVNKLQTDSANNTDRLHGLLREMNEQLEDAKETLAQRDTELAKSRASFNEADALLNTSRQYIIEMQNELDKAKGMLREKCVALECIERYTETLYKSTRSNDIEVGLAINKLMKTLERTVERMEMLLQTNRELEAPEQKERNPAGKKDDRSNDEAGHQIQLKLLEEKEKEIEHLESNVVQLKNEIELSNASLKEKGNELQQMKNELHGKVMENGELESLICDIKRELELSNTALKEKQSETQQMEREFGDQGVKIKHLESSIRDLKQDLEIRNNLLKEKSNKLQQMTREIQGKVIENQDLKSSISSIRRDLEMSNTFLKEKSNELERMQSKLEQKDMDIKDLASWMNDLKRDLELSDTSRKEQQNKLQQMTEELERKESSISDLKQDLEMRNNTLQEKNDQLQQMTRELQGKVMENQDLESCMKELKLDLELSNSSLQEKENELQGKVMENKDLESSMSDLKRDLELSYSSREEKQNEVQKMKRKLEKKDMGIKDLEYLSSDLKQKLEMSNTSMQEKENELQQMRNELEENVVENKALEFTMSELKQDLELNNTSLQQIRSDLQGKEMELQEAKEISSLLEADKEFLQHKLVELRTLISNQDNEIKEMKTLASTRDSDLRKGSWQMAQLQHQLEEKEQKIDLLKRGLGAKEHEVTSMTQNIKTKLFEIMRQEKTLDNVKIESCQSFQAYQMKTRYLEAVTARLRNELDGQSILLRVKDKELTKAHHGVQVKEGENGDLKLRLFELEQKFKLYKQISTEREFKLSQEKKVLEEKASHFQTDLEQKENKRTESGTQDNSEKERRQEDQGIKNNENLEVVMAKLAGEQIAVAMTDRIQQMMADMNAMQAELESKRQENMTLIKDNKQLKEQVDMLQAEAVEQTKKLNNALDHVQMKRVEIRKLKALKNVGPCTPKHQPQKPESCQACP